MGSHRTRAPPLFACGTRPLSTNAGGLPREWHPSAGDLLPLQLAALVCRRGRMGKSREYRFVRPLLRARSPPLRRSDRHGVNLQRTESADAVALDLKCRHPVHNGATHGPAGGEGRGIRQLRMLLPGRRVQTAGCDDLGPSPRPDRHQVGTGRFSGWGQCLRTGRTGGRSEQ